MLPLLCRLWVWIWPNPCSSSPLPMATVWDASSSFQTLGLMLVVTAILLPIVLVYTAWVFRVMRGRVSLDHLRKTHRMY